jgi:hypothetical protein
LLWVQVGKAPLQTSEAMSIRERQLNLGALAEYLVALMETSLPVVVVEPSGGTTIL